MKKSNHPQKTLKEYITTVFGVIVVSFFLVFSFQIKPASARRIEAFNKKISYTTYAKPKFSSIKLKPFDAFFDEKFSIPKEKRIFSAKDLIKPETGTIIDKFVEKEIPVLVETPGNDYKYAIWIPMDHNGDFTFPKISKIPGILNETLDIIDLFDNIVLGFSLSYDLFELLYIIHRYTIPPAHERQLLEPHILHESDCRDILNQFRRELPLSLEQERILQNTAEYRQDVIDIGPPPGDPVIPFPVDLFLFAQQGAPPPIPALPPAPVQEQMPPAVNNPVNDIINLFTRPRIVYERMLEAIQRHEAVEALLVRENETRVAHERLLDLERLLRIRARLEAERDNAAPPPPPGI